jgi:hypothetical protein
VQGIALKAKEIICHGIEVQGSGFGVQRLKAPATMGLKTSTLNAE